MATEQFAALEAAQERLAAISAEVKATSARARAVVTAAAETFAEARSERGEVSVTARVGGTITSMRFSEHALDLSATELASLTVRTIALAQHNAGTEFVGHASRDLGEDSTVVARLRTDIERAFPDPDNPDPDNVGRPGS